MVGSEQAQAATWAAKRRAEPNVDVPLREPSRAARQADSCDERGDKRLVLG